MNFITSHSIVSAYPLLTASMYALLNSHPHVDTPRVARCIQKYMRRGFTFLSCAEDWKPHHHCGADGYCGLTQRRVGDSTTMTHFFRNPHIHRPNYEIHERTVWTIGSRYPCKLPLVGYPILGMVHVLDEYASQSM